MDEPSAIKNPVTWSGTVRHFFTAMDVNCMRGVSGEHGTLLLNNHDSVKKNAHAILGQVRVGNMPPAHSGEPPWAADRIKQFEEWIAGGCR